MIQVGIDNFHVAQMCPISMEAYGKLPKSAKCVMLAWSKLFDKLKDYSAL